MKKFTLLLFVLVFLGVQNIAFSQSTISMGGGIMFSTINVFSNGHWNTREQFDVEPFIGFSYQTNLNQNLFLLTNLNYTKQAFDPFLSPVIDGIGSNQIKYVQISTSGLLNYKVFSSITKTKFWNRFKVGLGLNIDNLRDFKNIRFGVTEKLSRKENRNQLGFIYNVSWEYKNFKIACNGIKAMQMLENRDNFVTSTEWRTLSASYIYTLSD